MHSYGKIVFPCISKRLCVMRGGIPKLPSREVERHDSPVPVCDGELRELQRSLGWKLAKRANYGSRNDPELTLGTLESANLRFERLRQLQSSPAVQDRSISHFYVSHSIGSGIFAELVRDALDGIRMLHDRDGHLEPIEVILERLRIAHDHVIAKSVRGIPGHSDPVIASELEQCLGPY